jgi:hypothetical protein
VLHMATSHAFLVLFCAAKQEVFPVLLQHLLLRQQLRTISSAENAAASLLLPPAPICSNCCGCGLPAPPAVCLHNLCLPALLPACPAACLPCRTWRAALSIMLRMRSVTLTGDSAQLPMADTTVAVCWAGSLMICQHAAAATAARANISVNTCATAQQHARRQVYVVLKLLRCASHHTLQGSTAAVQRCSAQHAGGTSCRLLANNGLLQLPPLCCSCCWCQVLLTD